ncbi:hypothetical protein NDU88_001410 [Pleurodeles waltl]|uniref:Uncharacterized protein n=1 Tax=Pleurodeles waltl TaxID=8319 RepID=A0AAV7WKT3_PLEWA|nr:hypothetical protein NDU88_001410 [Pleurodeles waltl]
MPRAYPRATPWCTSRSSSPNKEPRPLASPSLPHHAPPALGDYAPFSANDAPGIHRSTSQTALPSTFTPAEAVEKRYSGTEALDSASMKRIGVITNSDIS